MSDPFEVMRIPEEEKSTASPPPPPSTQSPPRTQSSPVNLQSPGTSNPPGNTGHPPLPGPSDDPFNDMRIRRDIPPPRRYEGPPAPQGVAGPAPTGAKTNLADVPHLRTYSGSASFGIRLLAQAIDIVFVIALSVGLWFLMASLWNGKFGFDFTVQGYFSFALVLVALHILYELLCSQIAGSTIGRALCKLRVVQYNTGELISLSASIVRLLPASVALLIPFAGIVLSPLTFFSALWDPARLKRDWSDRITESTWVRRI